MRAPFQYALMLIGSALLLSRMNTQATAVPMTNPPSLPVIVRDVLPGEGWVKGVYKLRGNVAFYDTWKPARHRIATLGSKASVTILTGLSEVNQPDQITVTSPLPELDLLPQDELLRYTEDGEGWADFWAKGQWYRNADLGFVREAHGSGCQSKCKAQETVAGNKRTSRWTRHQTREELRRTWPRLASLLCAVPRKIWWFQVRLTDGRTGWTDAVDNLAPAGPPLTEAAQ